MKPTLFYIETKLQCKHQIAALFAEAVGSTRITTVDDLVVAELLQQ